MGTKHIDALTREAILQDLRDYPTESCTQIAKLHNVSHGVVYRIARRHKLNRSRRPGIAPKVRAKGVVGELLTEALSEIDLVRLAQQIGYSENTLIKVKNGSTHGALGVVLSVATLLGYELKLEKINADHQA